MSAGYYGLPLRASTDRLCGFLRLPPRTPRAVASRGRELTIGRYLPILVGDATTQARDPPAARDRDPRDRARPGAIGSPRVPRVRAGERHARARVVAVADRPRDAVQGARTAGGRRPADVPWGGRGGSRGPAPAAALRAHPPGRRGRRTIATGHGSAALDPDRIGAGMTPERTAALV